MSMLGMRVGLSVELAVTVRAPPCGGHTLNVTGGNWLAAGTLWLAGVVTKRGACGTATTAMLKVCWELFKVFVSVAVTVMTFVPNLNGTRTIVRVRLAPEPL